MEQRTCPVCNAVVSDTEVRCPVCTTVLHSVSYTGKKSREKSSAAEQPDERAGLKKCPKCGLVQQSSLIKCGACGCPLATTEAFSGKPAPYLSYAGFSMRCIAMLIDTALILAVVLPCMLLSYGSAYFTLDPLIKGPFDLLITWLLPALAVLVFWIVCGATPGKMFISARIVDAGTGEPAKPLQLIVRYYGYIISALPLCAGFMAISSDKKHRGWHDKLAGTAVILTKRPAGEKTR